MARDRAYERRRYEEWQNNLAVRKRKRRQTQQIVAAVVSSLAALAVIVGVTVLVTNGRDDDTGTTATSPSATASAPASASAAPSASASAAAPVKGGCTPSTLPAITSPKQTKTVPAKSVAAGKTFNLVLKTTCGSVTMKLDGKAAPQSVASTITLAKSGFYDKTPCHRLVTAGIYVLQCGDPTGTGTGSPGYSYGPLENVPKDYVYPAGTVAMARGSSPDSQGSQFFIVYQKSTIGSKDAGGYTVIGKITKGLDVIEKVAKSGSNNATGEGDGAPVTPVSILSTKVTGG